MSAEDLPLACYGAGGHGKVVAVQWQARRRGDLPAFADMRIPCGSQVGSFEVRWANLEDITGRQVLVTIGDNAKRGALQAQAVALGLPLATFVADERNFFTSAPGAGAMILAGAVVNTGAVIGEGAIVNTNAIVEHDCQIGAFVHLSPGACVAGGCRIGDGVWIGSNATVIPELAIAEGTVIGAGSTVVRPITEPGIYAGTPARRIR